MTCDHPPLVPLGAVSGPCAGFVPRIANRSFHGARCSAHRWAYRDTIAPERPRSTATYILGSVEFRVGHLSVIRAAGAPYSSLSRGHEGAPSWPLERAGVRAGSTCSLPPRPNPLPRGEGKKPVVLGIVAPTRNSTEPYLATRQFFSAASVADSVMWNRPFVGIGKPS